MRAPKLHFAAVFLGMIGSFVAGLIDLLYPPACVMCNRRVEQGAELCGECARLAIRVEPPRCEVCSRPFDGLMVTVVCPNCRRDGFAFGWAVSVMRCRGVVRELVHRFKYGRELSLRHLLGGWLAEGLRDSRFSGRTIDALVPVPLHRIRHRERGFNQAEELSRKASRLSGYPTECCLRRIRPTATQTRFDRRRRMRNLQDAFELRKNSRVVGKHLVLVDDILTTGSTLDECARVLLAGGAASVNAITVARG